MTQTVSTQKAAVIKLAESDPALIEELRAFIYSARRAFNRLVREGGAAKQLQEQAEKRYQDAPKAKAYWSSNAMSHPSIKKFVNRFNLTKDKEKFLLSKLQEGAFGKDRTAAWESLRRYLEPAYIERKREEARGPAYAVGIPKEIVDKFFPSSFAFDVAPDGTVIREFEIFGNEKNTLEKKRKAMLLLLQKWNELVDRLNTDLKSQDPTLRLKALVTSIIISTGIRPAEAGESKLKDDFGKIIRDDEGNPIRVKTVGATGILPEHVDFVRDDFAVIEFPGKHGTKNVAEITDPIIIEALKAQIASSDANADGPVFVTPGGKRITPKDVNSYLHAIMGPDVTATDFRKLKATQVFYSSLKRRKHELAYKLKKLKGLAESDMKKKIVATIVDYLYEAAEHAKDAISHTDIETTLDYYTTPRVVMSFLADKGINRALDAVVGDGRELQINFDPIEFFEHMTDTSVKAASLRLAKTMFYFGDEFVKYNVDDAIEELDGDDSSVD